MCTRRLCSSSNRRFVMNSSMANLKVNSSPTTTRFSGPCEQSGGDSVILNTATRPPKWKYYCDYIRCCRSYVVPNFSVFLPALLACLLAVCVAASLPQSKPGQCAGRRRRTWEERFTSLVLFLAMRCSALLCVWQRAEARKEGLRQSVGLWNGPAQKQLRKTKGKQANSVVAQPPSHTQNAGPLLVLCVMPLAAHTTTRSIGAAHVRFLDLLHPGEQTWSSLTRLLTWRIHSTNPKATLLWLTCCCCCCGCRLTSA